MAELALERASIFSEQGGDPLRIRREYDGAVDALIQANEAGSVAIPNGIERYFDLLVAEANGQPSSDTFERFFRAAQAIGDDTLQKESTGRVVPDSFTHGTSAQRMHWLQRGIQTGDPAQCDTFSGAI